MDQAQNGEANGRAIRGRSRGGDNTPSEVGLMGVLEKLNLVWMYKLSTESILSRWSWLLDSRCLSLGLVANGRGAGTESFKLYLIQAFA
jgi:hypothetical protein